MHRIFFLSVLAFAVVCLIQNPIFANEESDEVNETVTITITPTEKTKSRMMEEKKNVMMQKKEDAALFKASMEDKMEERKASREAAFEAFKAKREEAKEQFKEKREAFQEKLATIRDEKKQERVAAIDKKISSLNESHTQNLAQALDKLTDLIARFQTKIDKAKTAGTDTTKLEEALAQAQSLLSSAETAVTEQAGKEYVVTLTSESSLRADVKITFEQFRRDIQAVHAKVKAAHASIREIAIQLESLHKSLRPSEKPEVETQTESDSTQ